jgi:glycosyltransferase involved in cell wall biosynthesis
MTEVGSNTQPWELPLLDRLRMLNGGDLRVAYFSEAFEQGSFRYRCYNMAQTLNASSSGIRASFFIAEDLAAIKDLATHADVLVLSRVRYDSIIHRLIDSFHGMGKQVFYDIDDLIFDPSFAPLIASTLNYTLWGKDLDNWFALAARIRATLDLSDHVITTTAYLADQVALVTAKPVTVVSNFVNQEQLDASAGFSRQIDPTMTTLGYFSGSTSHQKDFEIALPALLSFLGADVTHRLTIAGYLELPDVFTPYQNQITRLAFMSPAKLQHAIGSVDANIVPLQDNPFTASKSELKYFEAALVHTPTIASPTPPYQQAIRHLDNGVLAKDNDWEAAIAEFHNLTVNERREMGGRAHRDALRKFTPEHATPGLTALFRGTQPGATKV